MIWMSGFLTLEDPQRNSPILWCLKVVGTNKLAKWKVPLVPAFRPHFAPCYPFISHLDRRQHRLIFVPPGKIRARPTYTWISMFGSLDAEIGWFIAPKHCGLILPNIGRFSGRKTGWCVEMGTRNAQGDCSRSRKGLPDGRDSQKEVVVRIWSQWSAIRKRSGRQYPPVISWMFFHFLMIADLL